MPLLLWLLVHGIPIGAAGLGLLLMTKVSDWLIFKKWDGVSYWVTQPAGSLLLVTGLLVAVMIP